MNYRVLGLDDYKMMPWKNGGGLTCEIRREPAEGDFHWRLSIAQIKENGPFSKFPQYTRIINTLRGAGMILSVDGEKSRRLIKYDPFVFSGASETSSELIDGPIDDFNLIFNPGYCQATLKWMEAAQPVRIETEAELLLIYSTGNLVAEIDSNRINVAENSTLELNNNGQKTTLSLSAASESDERHFCLIEIRAASKN